MAVNVSKSGGIYIEINGNVQPLEQAIGKAKTIGYRSLFQIRPFRY